jgi:hypothetical protein
MDKPTVYIETTIAGHLTSRLPKDPLVAGQMLLTRQWWSQSRTRYECSTSQLVLVEAGRGDPVAARERLQVLADLPVVRPNDLRAVDDLVDLLLARGALPAKARADATHLATAAATGMQYLLTWNCRHLANVTVRGRIEQACRDSGFTPPLICTPAELNEDQP